MWSFQAGYYKKLNEVLKAVLENAPKENSDLYQKYKYYSNSVDSEESDFLCFAGCEAAGNGKLSEALTLLDEAVSRGNVFAIRAVNHVYMDILDVCSSDETEAEYWKVMREWGNKMQVYGKILSDAVEHYT